MKALSLHPPSSKAIILSIENDSRRIGGPGSDNAYTSGIKFTTILAEEQEPSWARALSDASLELKKFMQNSHNNFGISLGQKMYTPNQTDRSDLIVKDRPYAGWLYVGFDIFVLKEEISHSLEFSLGIIGPEARGEWAQNKFHQVIGVNGSEGWSHQLGTEPTVEVSYQRRTKRWEFFSGEDGRYFDVIEYFGASLGNVKVDSHFGGVLRFGTHLPDDYGPARPSAQEGSSYVDPVRFLQKDSYQKIGLFIFTSVRGYLVAHDIFIDGNSFRESHRVSRIPWVSESEAGAGFSARQFAGVWRFVVRSPEFEEKPNYNSFASISLSYFIP